MSKHTPGPWELSEAQYKEGFGTYRRVEQVEQFGDVVASVCIRHAVNHTLNACGDANARLIAAAPDLLEALESVWLWMENQADGQSKGGHATFDLLMLREQRDIARAAIAKATGEQP